MECRVPYPFFWSGGEACDRRGDVGAGAVAGRTLAGLGVDAS